MVDLGISRAQDIKNPLAANLPLSRPPAEGQDRSPRTSAPKADRAQEPKGTVPGGRPADLDNEVRRLNDLLGSSTRIQFVINRTTNDVYVEVVDKESNKVLKT